MSKRIRVTKSNALIQAAYKLKLNEQRLLLAVIARIDSRIPMRSYTFTITAREFAEIFDMEMQSAYEALQDASDTLFERDIRTFDGHSKSRFRWVDKVSYIPGESRVELTFTTHVVPYLSKLHENLTSYGLHQVANLKSTYSIRLFEMLAQFRKTGWLQIPVDDFRERLMLADAYKRFDNLRARVIQPAVNELQEKSNLTISWKPIREGRKVASLLFEFHEDEQMDLLKPTVPEYNPEAALEGVKGMVQTAVRESEDTAS